MKAKLFACSLTLALAALTGCSGSQSGINRSLGQAEATRTLATDSKFDSHITSSAYSKLVQAKNLKEDGKIEEAQALAEQSELDMRLAIAKSENDKAKYEDKKLEEALRADEERKRRTQSALPEHSR